MEPDGMILKLDRHEGIILYQDARMQGQTFPTFGHLTLVVIMTNNQGSQVLWHSHGIVSSIAESIAYYYFANPGMKEAVDGLFALVQARGGKR